MRRSKEEEEKDYRIKLQQAVRAVRSLEEKGITTISLELAASLLPEKPEWNK